MEKVIAMNLNGRAYQLEEAGFTALRAYLDSASARLAQDPSKSEIIADLEQAIAEKCDRVLGSNKNVVTTPEIEKIIGEMGPVESDGAAADEKHEQTQSAAPKRLYRIEEGKILWGVCTGLAAYFGVDVALVRVLFALLAIITGGGACFLYFAMMILIPEADTMQQKAAAHGEPFNAQELINRAKAEYQRWSVHLSDMHDEHVNVHASRREWKQRRREMRRMHRHYSSPLVGVIKGALAALWILALISIIMNGTVFTWPIPAGIPIWVAIVLLFVLYHAVTGPMRSPSYARYGEYEYSESDGVGSGLTVLFLAIAFGWAYLHMPHVHDFVHHPIVETKVAIAQIKAWWHR